MYHYLPTCRVFTEIKNRNFPDVCPDSDALFLYRATNFGFGGETNKVVKTFHYVLYSSATTLYAADIAGGSWWWVNSTACPPEVYKGNIWMCDFIPFSKCVSSGGKKETGKWEFGHFEAGRKGSHYADHKTLRSMGIDGHYLTKYGEGKSYERMIRKLDSGDRTSLDDW
jgi:hypothetical protein